MLLVVFLFFIWQIFIYVKGMQSQEAHKKILQWVTPNKGTKSFIGEIAHLALSLSPGRVRARAPHGLASCCVLTGVVCVDGPDGPICPECPFSRQSDPQGSTLRRQASQVIFSIADTGIGIPEEALPNIFDRFYRVQSTADFDARGSGLGLTLVKHVIDAHGWQVEVKSTPGQGSIFSISIPLNANEKKSK